ncbi:ovaries absent [Lycorma delicatula]|uniref:ovaries absent n=1 Tax=Lycorma delicatula TaxID=130591 RepID=UPI003F5166B4
MDLECKPCVVQISVDAFRFAYVNPEFTVCYLPVMFAGGIPTSLEKITEEQLEVFLPFMIQCSLNHPDNTGGTGVAPIYHRGKDVFSGPKPSWWFKDLPFRYPLRISGMWRNKFAVLKSLVCRCYTYYNCEYMLRVCAELAELPREKLFYENHSDENMLSMFTEERFLIKFWNENMLYDCNTREVFELSSDSEDEAIQSNHYSEKLTNQIGDHLLKFVNDSEVGGDEEENDDDDDDDDDIMNESEDNIHSDSKDDNSIEEIIIDSSPQSDTVVEMDSIESEPSTSNINLRKRKEHNEGIILKSQKKTKQNKPTGRSVIRHKLDLHLQPMLEEQTELQADFEPGLSSKKESMVRYSRLSNNESSYDLSSLGHPVTKDEYMASLFNLAPHKKEIVPVQVNTPQSPFSHKKGRSKKYLSKRTQLKIFHNVALSSDLGRAYLLKIHRKFILTQHHVDKIERYVNRDNHSNTVRRSDVCMSASATNYINNTLLYLHYAKTSCSSIDSVNQLHNPLTSTQCCARFYKFPKCRKCITNSHNEMQKCNCLSGSTKLNFSTCYVKLDPLSKETLDLLMNRKNIGNEKTNRASESSSSCTTKNEIEIIDLTNDDSDDEEIQDDGEDLVDFVLRKTSQSPKKYFRKTSSSNIARFDRNVLVSKEGSSEFDRLMLKKSFQSPKKDPARTSSDHFVHSRKDSDSNSKRGTNNLRSGSVESNKDNTFHNAESLCSLKEGDFYKIDSEVVVLKQSLQSTKKDLSEPFDNRLLHSESYNLISSGNNMKFEASGSDISIDNISTTARIDSFAQLSGSHLCIDSKKTKKKKLSAATEVTRSERVLSEPGFNCRLMSENVQNKESEQSALMLHSLKSNANCSPDSNRLLIQNIWADDHVNSNFRQQINPYLSGTISSPKTNHEM